MNALRLKLARLILGDGYTVLAVLRDKKYSWGEWATPLGGVVAEVGNFDAHVSGKTYIYADSHITNE
jgi:hypothetical protein